MLRTKCKTAAGNLKGVFMEQSFTVTQIKIKKSILHITLKANSPISNLRISLFHQNPDQEICYPFHVDPVQNCVCTAFIDLSPLKISEGDWNVVVHTAPTPTKEYCPVVLDKQVRARLLVSRNLIIKDPLIIFPMGTSGHRMILRCRIRRSYDSLSFRIKEFAAFGTAKLLGPLLKKKKLWLVFEKYCTSAQDNGFYFFRHCMENLPPQEKKHIYFILDKNSVQWPIIQKYQKQVLPFLSFRHILYMLTADLYIGSDARLHAYAWTPMPNLISREINKHDIFFLQHGVTALKRVDSIFGAQGASPMTYFVVTSVPEQNIVTRYFGYDKAHTPVLGFTRWDVLEDKTDIQHRKILVMPTWRSWLEDKNDDFFCSSQYYKTYMHLLQNQKLLSFLKETDTELIFYIHPKLREFMQNFHADSTQIRLIPFGSAALNELIMKCSMLITDYSSVCWDASYLNKPVVFYQFDTDAYETTNGSYIDMEHDLPGDRCTEEEQLIELIKEYAANDFREKKCYSDMNQKYFAYHDRNNCKRTYDFILKNCQK